MSKLDAAIKRFSTALEELKARAGERIDSERDTNASDAQTIARLRARIATLEQEARELTGITAEVEERLDGAIAEIRSALDRN